MMAGAATAAKLAALAVKEKDNTGKILAAIMIGILAPFLLIIVCVFSLITALLPEGALPDSGTIDISKTGIYQSVKPVMDEYYESVKKGMEEEKQKLIEENTIEETIQGADGSQITIKKCKLTNNKIISR